MTTKEYIQSLPPSSVNNARSIVSAKVRRFEKFPSEIAAREVERVTAGELQADWSDDDYGEPNYKNNEN